MPAVVVAIAVASRRQGRCVMYRHASTCLKGPKSRSRAWWQDVPGEEIDRVDSAVVEEVVRGRRRGAMRLDLIARVRREIAEGTYDSPEKWEAALDRLLERLDQH
jgi:hypothetical protein